MAISYMENDKIIDPFLKLATCYWFNEVSCPPGRRVVRKLHEIWECVRGCGDDHLHSYIVPVRLYVFIKLFFHGLERFQ